MRHSFICPKCNSSQVVLLEGTRYNQAAIIYLNRLGSTAVMDRYVCTACGFTEQWVQLDEKFNRWVEKQHEEGKTKSDFV
jgi:predicted RNA-binding Zn-ribbon protein involved in translation (DUF1610 family)